MILKGSVEIYEKSSLDDEEDENKVVENAKVMTAVGSFGEKVLTGSRVRDFTVICREASEFVVLDRANYQEVMRKSFWPKPFIYPISM